MRQRLRRSDSGDGLFGKRVWLREEQIFWREVGQMPFLQLCLGACHQGRGAWPHPPVGPRVFRENANDVETRKNRHRGRGQGGRRSSRGVTCTRAFWGEQGLRVSGIQGKRVVGTWHVAREVVGARGTLWTSRRRRAEIPVWPWLTM